MRVPLQRQPQAALSRRLAQGILAMSAGWILFVLLRCVTVAAPGPAAERDFHELLDGRPDAEGHT